MDEKVKLHLQRAIRDLGDVASRAEKLLSYDMTDLEICSCVLNTFSFGSANAIVGIQDAINSISTDITLGKYPRKD